MPAFMPQSTSSRSNAPSLSQRERDRRVQQEKLFQYRHLVSRVMTQRLQSPSLTNIAQLHETNTQDNTLAAWELRERHLAHAKVQAEVELLGVSWDQLIHDVGCETRKVRVLSPTTYQAPLQMERLERHIEQKEDEYGRAYKRVHGVGKERDVEWERKRAEVFALLKSAGEERGTRYESWE